MSISDSINIGLILLPIIGGLVLLILKLIETKLPAGKQKTLNTVIGVVTHAVQAVEQISSNGIQPMSGDKKKATAMSLIDSFLKTAGIKNVSDDAVMGFIESAVYLLKQNQTTTLSISSPTPATPPVTGTAPTGPLATAKQTL